MTLDLLPTDVEKDLRATVRDLLAERCEAARVREMYDGDRSIVEPLWQAVGRDLGLAGLLIPDELGGAGASAREVAVVLEELGRAVAPVPFLTSAAVATTVLLAISETDLVGRLAEGSVTAALAVPFNTGPESALPDIGVDGTRLTGTVTSVAGALEADVLLVPAGGGLWAVDRATTAPVSSLDMSRQLADVSFDQTEARLVADDATDAIAQGLRAGAALLASEQVGLARWCLEATVGYLKERRQFGRVVGGFQALKHRLADLYTAVESASASAAYAAATLAEGDPDAEIAGAVAAAYCGDLAVRAAEEALQLHGGIGMTWEHPLHLYLKRAKADQIALGSTGSHRRRLAVLVDLPPAGKDT